MERSKVDHEQTEIFKGKMEVVYSEQDCRTSRDVLGNIANNISQTPLKATNADNDRMMNDDKQNYSGSILKRLRRPSGKENVNDNNTTVPVQKRVRIVTPDDDFLPSKGIKDQEKDRQDYIDYQDVIMSKSITQLPSATKDFDSCFILQEENQIEDFKVNIDVNHTTNPERFTLPTDGRRTRRNRKDFEHWLLIRYQPKVLSDAIKSLSSEQRKWVKSTGFGSILSFRMNQYPQGLSYYLAMCFETHTGSLTVGNITIPITDDDVHEVLGLPKGKNSVQTMKSNHIEIMWRDQFKSHVKLGWKITANLVCEAIKNSNEVDRLFKLNFLILLSNVLIEGPKNPYVKQNLLGFTGDLDNMGQYNWCRYLISSLKVATVAWSENPTTQYYTGSVPLLVYIYMDRVVKGKRQVRRKKPTFVGWSDSKILDRQIADISSKTFFQGKIALPLRYKDSDDESSYEDYTWNNNAYSESESDEVDDQKCNKGQKSSIVVAGNDCLNYYDNSEDNLDYKLKNVEMKRTTTLISPMSLCINQKQNDKPVTISNVFHTGTTSIAEKATVSQSEVPRYVIDNLKESIDGYENLQAKCIMYLLSARNVFKNNRLVSSLQSRFLSLVERAEEFVINELKMDVVSGGSQLPNQVVTTSGNQIQSLKSDVVISGQKEDFKPRDEGCNSINCDKSLILKSPLDEDLCLSTQDWLYIDSFSVTPNVNQANCMDVFNNMESQSKTLNLENTSVISGFKTPGDDRVFKVPIDATIPAFCLVDNEEERNSKADIKLDAINTDATGRPKREKKISVFQKSPFMERVTDIHRKSFRKEENDLWNWLHSNRKNPNRVIFKWEHMMCYKLDFQSMKEGEMVMTSVFDVWSCFLNWQEDFRSPTSPRRLFCFIETTLGTLNGIDERTKNKKFNMFEENMEHIMHTYGTKISDYDMVFFPMYNFNHYFVVCYNLKNPSVEILDNRKSTQPINALYGQQVVILHKQFESYLKKRNHQKYIEIGSMDQKRLTMPWQTVSNGVDCGIFAMRHMETYYGGGVRSWESKIAPEGYTQRNQMITLRILFTYKMLSCPINCVYGVIQDEIKDPSLLRDELTNSIIPHNKFKK